MEKLRHGEIDCLAQGCATSLTRGGGDRVWAQSAESKAHPLLGTSGYLVRGCLHFLLPCGVRLAWPFSSGCETEARLNECTGQSGSHRRGRILPRCDQTRWEQVLGFQVSQKRLSWSPQRDLLFWLLFWIILFSLSFFLLKKFVGV